MVQLENLSCKNLVGSLVEPDIDALEEGWYYYKYKNQYGNTYDNLQVSFTAENDIEDLYWFGRGTEYFLHNVFVDGELRYMETTASPQTTIHIGKVEKGQEIVIYVYPLESEGKKGTDVEWAMQFAEFDEDAYAKAYELLSKNVYDVETFEDDYVKGSIHVDEDGIMMTSIQASEGFEVFVDGEKTEYEIVGNTMIGVPLSAGEHEVEFKYHTPRVLAADVLSLCCLGVFILLCILGRREKKSQSKPFEIAEE